MPPTTLSLNPPPTACDPDRGRPDAGGPVEPFQGSDGAVQLREPHPEEGGAVVLSLRAEGSVRPWMAVSGTVQLFSLSACSSHLCPLAPVYTPGVVLLDVSAGATRRREVTTRS